MLTLQEPQAHQGAGAPTSGADQKAAPFDVEALAAALLAAVGPNDPFPDQDMLKVYPCKFPK